ncbi:MAG TPA: Re/Si-specific NAD(P)(+) transhydrogenase subunit alpha [Chitinophagaceae bacterium]|nr:Re/Si-specific NAD(P)(+) transhydrogenase subunit alpha [Chitinophagaceae bacterium]HAL94997.1 Re/Si-specific NAD(P)(+) transhydrogenase subunit alpha [Chitinophagaceae bacterium]
MTIGVLRESAPETRVSITDEIVATLTKKGHQVLVEKGAGENAFCTDAAYEAAGAKVADRSSVIAEANIILGMHSFSIQAESALKDKILIGAYQPLYRKDWVQQVAACGVTCFSLDMLPRTTRAQSMDILSSQANIAGYKAVLLAANSYGRYFPMFMTAAGSIAPAKVLILGAGVAGLQAIATAKRLGAVVEVFDTRPAVKEEVMSLGAKFIEVEGAADASKAGGYAVEQSEEYQRRQRERIAQSAAKADIIITTAQIPGKRAPLLITEEMIASMRNGSVIVDLAASTGGNTPYTKDAETVVKNGVSIIGASSLPATLSADASKLYGKNLYNFLQLLLDKNNALVLNWDDDLVKGSCITHEGKIVHERLA